MEIDPHEKSRDLRQAIQALLYAKVLMASYHTNATAIPLNASSGTKYFNLLIFIITSSELKKLVAAYH